MEPTNGGRFNDWPLTLTQIIGRLGMATGAAA